MEDGTDVFNEFKAMFVNRHRLSYLSKVTICLPRQPRWF